MVTKIYANAVAKYNEGKLLDGDKLLRLIDADFSDAVKMLCDYGYGGGVLGDKSFDIDSFISLQTSALIAYVLSDSPSDYVTRVLLNKFTYGNAKAYYKAKCLGKLNLYAVYNMPDTQMREGIESGEYSALPKFMADALLDLDNEFFESKPDPKKIDLYLTRAMYADNVNCAKKSKNKALIRFVRGEIDLTNITSALRARSLSVSQEELKGLFISGGALEQELIYSIYSAENPAAIIRETQYDFIIENNENAEITRFETRTDDYLYEIWQRGAEDMNSVSPFVSYFLAQMKEYKTVKMILTCLKNNARSEIMPRLRK